MVRDIYIDADHILYAVAGNPAKNMLDGDILEVKPDMAMLKRKFMSIVKDYEDLLATETVSKKFTLGATHLVFSDPYSNFRYDIYPEYKAHRKGDRSKAFYRLRKWAHKKYPPVKNTEADDIVAYYVRKGAVGVSTDKDLLKGVPGRWLDCYHSRMSYEKTKKKAARYFVLVQTLAGDPTDNIKGMPRVGHTTAEKLLERFGADWLGVVAAYASKGLTETDAVLTRRLVGMDQWSPKKGVRLWNP